jgi:ABC-2 type transport system ATP-binding protein
LRVEALVKRFGQVTAVDGITLELRAGECLGLLGPNGAGKSTLIRSIVGRVIPDEGTISVFGSPADSVEARNTLGWIPQELALYPRLTCRENLQAFGRYHGMGDAHRSRRRIGQESLRRHEAAAQHGSWADSPAQACPDG